MATKKRSGRKKAVVAKKRPAAVKRRSAAIKKRPAAKRPTAAGKKKPAAGKRPRPPKKTPSAPARKREPEGRSEDATEKLAAATHKLLGQTWARWGTVESDVISHAINPSFMGGPRWPGMRQAYRVAHRDGRVLIASDGLSDPYDPGEGPEDANGLGIEFFAIADDTLARSGNDTVARYGATWLHDLVFQLAQNAAFNGGYAARIDQLGAMSTELYDVSIPAPRVSRFVNDAGRVGVLLVPGFENIPPRITGPLGRILLVHAILVTLPELAYLVEGGEGARNDLIAKLAGQYSGLDRPSVI